MKISIVGGGNMGGAIARGLSTCDLFRPQDITVINRRASKTAEIQGFNPELQAVTGDYSSLATADIVVIASETLDGGGTDKRASDREAAR